MPIYPEGIVIMLIAGKPDCRISAFPADLFQKAECPGRQMMPPAFFF